MLHNIGPGIISHQGKITTCALQNILKIYLDESKIKK